MNITVHTPNAPPIFVKTVNTTAESLNSEKPAAILIDAAEELGIEKWLTVVFDNASVNMAAGRLI